MICMDIKVLKPTSFIAIEFPKTQVAPLLLEPCPLRVFLFSFLILLSLVLLLCGRLYGNPASS